MSTALKLHGVYWTSPPPPWVCIAADIFCHCGDVGSLACPPLRTTTGWIVNPSAVQMIISSYNIWNCGLVLFWTANCQLIPKQVPTCWCDCVTQCSVQVFNFKKGIFSMAFDAKKALTTVVSPFFINIFMITLWWSRVWQQLVYLPYNRLQVNDSIFGKMDIYI